MASSSIFLSLFILQFTLFFSPIHSKKLFREYIGAEGKNVKFTDLPINNAVEFHFILSFAIDYTGSASPKPTNGDFNVFWDTDNLTPSQVLSIKSKHPNVRVAMSLGGDSVGPKDESVFFAPASINSWVKNAISSITSIVKEYHLDGIDIDYEHFNTDTNTFAECIGRLIFALKQNKVVQIVSIAPYDDGTVNQYYLALWKKYGNLIDYVNFQFYAYDKGTTISQFLKFYDIQSKNYNGGTLMASFGTDNSGGLKPKNGFFTACNMLASKGKLHGIFIWSADDSKKDGYKFEKQSQQLLGSVK